jgi:hypothetical protein
MKQEILLAFDYWQVIWLQVESLEDQELKALDFSDSAMQ